MYKPHYATTFIWGPPKDVRVEASWFGNPKFARVIWRVEQLGGIGFELV